MQRYFVSEGHFTNNKVTITGDDVHHIIRVVRFNIGDKIICSNGKGLDVIAEINSLDNDRVDCNIIEVIQDTREPNVEIYLAQALPKTDKMELILQKGTEIGITKFLPFTSERTIVKLNEKKEQNKLIRWQRIVKEAAEQAHRSIIPEISPVIDFNDLLHSYKDMLILIAYENESNTSLFDVLKINSEIKKVLLIIGSEGGFSKQEIAKAIDNGAIPVSLGRRILRTETAGLVGAANILYHLEHNR